MGPNPNEPRSVSCDRVIRYSGLGVRSVGPWKKTWKKTKRHSGSARERERSGEWQSVRFSWIKIKLHFWWSLNQGNPRYGSQINDSTVVFWRQLSWSQQMAGACVWTVFPAWDVKIHLENGVFLLVFLRSWRKNLFFWVGCLHIVDVFLLEP